VVLADAKYKVSRALDASDGYQLFAYSHLASFAGAPSDMGLVLYVPAPPEVRPGSNNGSGSLTASSRCG
jgi:hypothetical protein